MSRKNESGPSGSSSRSLASLKSLRTQIDKLDLNILKFVNERARLATEIGKVKSDSGGEVFSPGREEEVFQNVLQHNKGPLDDATIRAIYREIISGGRAIQQVLKVACLGPEFSYSHLAAVERFGQAAEFSLVGSIPAVFEEVNRGHCHDGAVPLENSTDGRVADTPASFLPPPQTTTA